MNYNPHNNSYFLLLQEYLPAVANWFKLRSYIGSTLFYVTVSTAILFTHCDVEN
jgi:hypothetical protein